MNLKKTFPKELSLLFKVNIHHTEVSIHNFRELSISILFRVNSHSKQANFDYAIKWLLTRMEQIVSLFFRVKNGVIWLYSSQYIALHLNKKSMLYNIYIQFNMTTYRFFDSLKHFLKWGNFALVLETIKDYVFVFYIRLLNICVWIWNPRNILKIS